MPTLFPLPRLLLAATTLVPITVVATTPGQGTGPSRSDRSEPEGRRRCPRHTDARRDAMTLDICHHCGGEGPYLLAALTGVAFVCWKGAASGWPAPSPDWWMPGTRWSLVAVRWLVAHLTARGAWVALG